MASTRKLNPYAAPYPLFPHNVVTRTVPAPIPPFVFSYQPLPNWGYHLYPNQFLFNVNTEATYREPSGCERGFEDKAAAKKPKKAVKGRRPRNLAPRLRCSRNMVHSFGMAQQWLPKNEAAEESRFVKKEAEAKLCGRTSLMIRNIPNQFERHNLMHILDKHCLEANKNKAKGKSAYDFLYLPMDFKTGGNFGYAFVNFTSSVGATSFYQAFNNLEWDVPINRKICKICCAKIQGKVGLTNHFKNSIFSCSRKDYLPVVLTPPRDGVVRSRAIVIGSYGAPSSSHASEQ